MLKVLISLIIAPFTSIDFSILLLIKIFFLLCIQFNFNIIHKNKLALGGEDSNLEYLVADTLLMHNKTTPSAFS